MNKLSPTILFIIYLILFVIGYFATSKMIDLYRDKARKRSKDNTDSDGFRENNQTEDKNGPENDYDHKDDYITPEKKYKKIFGFMGPVSRDDIKKRYRELVTKYHPDKVQHLGEEFQQMAEEKTKLIQEAYEYFKKAYNIQD